MPALLAVGSLDVTVTVGSGVHGLPHAAAHFHPLLTADSLKDLFYSLLVTLFGIGFVVYGFHRHRQRRLMQDTATSTVEAAAVGSVELVGTAEPAEATVTAPLTGEECVAVVYEVEEYKHLDDLTREWVTVDDDVVAEPFFVNDGTGRLLVDSPESSTNYDVSEANRTREQYASPDAQPATLDAFLSEYTEVSPESEYTRRYTQQVVPVGADAYVFGDAEAAEDVEVDVDSASDLVVTEDADTELFLVSDETERELVSGRRFSLVAWGLVGVAVFAFGLWWFLDTLGVS